MSAVTVDPRPPDRPDPLAAEVRRLRRLQATIAALPTARLGLHDGPLGVPHADVDAYAATLRPGDVWPLRHELDELEAAVAALAVATGVLPDVPDPTLDALEAALAAADAPDDPDERIA